MTAVVLPFPATLNCPHCSLVVRTVRLDAHLSECPVLASKRAHPSNRGRGA